MRQWARDNCAGPFLPHQIPQDGRPRYLSVRDPEDRFASLWRSCQQENYYAQSFVVEYDLIRCNPSVLMDVIEKHKNQHWEPQISWWVDKVQPIPYNRLLSFLGLPERWENRTTGNPPFLPVYRLRQHYNRDYDLWNMALDFQAAV